MRDDASLRTELARRGFTDTARAVRFLASPALAGIDQDAMVDSLGASADPDAALLALLRLREAGSPVTEQSAEWESTVRVLGASSYWADYLVAHPELVPTLRETTLDVAHAGVYQQVEEAVVAALEGGHDAVAALRRTYREILLRFAAADLDASAPGREATEDTEPRAARAIAILVGATLHGALLIARAQHPEADGYAFTIVAMGKTGAEELNYISDVDVVYVCDGGEEAVEATTHLATAVMRAVSEVGSEPPLWPLDVALRPEGKDGPLVRTLDSHVEYYRRWAATWEFQALLKARPVAGDIELGHRYVAAVSPMVWSAVERENFVEDSQAMRRRVEEHVRGKDADRQLKLGPGGLRDVEFTVQLLQLVHGRTDETLRVRATLDALAALARGGYIGRDHAAELARCYEFLRALEHRIQLHRMRRSHVVPSRPADLRRLSRLLGVADVEIEWTRTRRRVRELHEAIFYRPLLPLTARLSASEVSLQPEAARARLAAIGYRDPAGALRHIAALTEGVSRRAAIQRQLLPVMIGWFAQGADPDSGLLEFRKFSEQLGSTHWYLKLLRDSGTVAERLAGVLSSSVYVAEALSRLPESVQWLADDGDLAGRDFEALYAELDAMLSRRDVHKDAVDAVRYLRRRELTRAALGDVLDCVDPARAEAITVAADVAVAGALRVALHDARAGADPAADPADFAVIAMGRMGGGEMNYGSDADLMFVYRARGDEQLALEFAAKVAGGLRTVLTEPSEEPPLPVDPDLRPEGRRGPIVRSLSSYAEYYSRWVEPWECLALLRARPVAGDGALIADFIALIDSIRYPAEGVSREALTSLRRIKARVEAERMPRGVPANRHIKLGRGGLTDVEFTAQLLQLQHAGRYPVLRTTQTLQAISAAQSVGLLTVDDAGALSDSWRLATRTRDAIVLSTGRVQKADVLPRVGRELSVVSRLLGYEAGESLEFEEDYLRSARRARRVVERVFFADS